MMDTHLHLTYAPCGNLISVENRIPKQQIFTKTGKLERRCIFGVGSRGAEESKEAAPSLSRLLQLTRGKEQLVSAGYTVQIMYK